MARVNAIGTGYEGADVDEVVIPSSAQLSVCLDWSDQNAG